MATYTTTQDGPWNDPNTWGGGGFPQVSTDIFNIGHIVTMNVNFDPASVAFGGATDCVINNGGKLIHARNMNTHLPFGNGDLKINAGGEWAVGESGLIIPKAYTTGASWDTTTHGVKGINLANGGKLTVYGDPDYFGSDYDTVLAADGTNGAGDGGAAGFIVTADDMSAKWQVGQQLIIHKGAAHANYVADFLAGVGGVGLPTIVSFGAANKINLDVLVPTTFKAGADVLNVSRNVIFYKYGYVETPGNQNSLAPRVLNANVTGTNNINISDALFGGFYQVCVGYGNNFNGVAKNGVYPINSANYGSIAGIFAFNYLSINALKFASLNGCFCGNLVGAIGGSAYSATGPGTITGRFFGNEIALRGVVGDATLYIYSNGAGMFLIPGQKLRGSLGYNANGLSMPNTVNCTYQCSYGIATPETTTKFFNVKSSTLVFRLRNTALTLGRYVFEHYQQVADAHYIADAFGDIIKTPADGTDDNPSQRSGGNADIIEVVPQSLCSSLWYLGIFNFRVWAEAGVSKTYRFYVQTDFASLLTTAFKLYGEYLDEATGGHLATVSSTQDITTRSSQADWSQYVEVTINPAQTGYVNLYLRLMGYEAAKKVWVDPMPEVAGKSYECHWSEGEVVVTEAGNGGGVSPTQFGLVPLGVKQGVV